MFDLVKNMFFTAFLAIDSVIYDLIRYVYQIFVFLAELNLFSEEDYMGIVNRIYIILGVVMLFVLAYSLLKAVINPDDFAKKDNSFPNLIKNVIVSLIIIIILPTVFTVAFSIQTAVFNTDIIPKVILGDDGSGYTNKVKENGGNDIAINVYNAFFHPNMDYCADSNINDMEECRAKIKGNDTILWFFGGTYLSESYANVASGKSFWQFVKYSGAVNDGQISYMVVISTLVGLLLLLVLASYCIDLGVRVIKLMFYQIIAPIPVISRILPSDQGKKIFGNWMKQTITIFIEAFIRIAIMYLGVYIIQLIVYRFETKSIPNLSSLGITQQLLVIALLITGVVLFVRQAPKILKDLFGFDLGGNLNPFSKMLGIGASLGAGSLAGIRNFYKERNKGSNLGKSFLSAAAGFGSGLVRGGYAARNAKSLKDMKSAASAGVKGATDAKAKREKYRADHGGTLDGVVSGHFQDFTDWLTGAGVEELDKVINSASKVKKATDDMHAAAEKQMEKHLTDVDIATKMEKDSFKGTEAELLYDLYKQFYGQSFATIKQEMERRKEQAKKGDFTEEARRLVEKPVEPVRPEVMTATSEAEYNAAMRKYNEDMASYESRVAMKAQELTRQATKEAGLLESMYNQWWKASRTAVEQAAINGEAVGEALKVSDLFETRELATSAQDVIRASGLRAYDPSKDEAIEVKDGNVAKFIDDFSTGAQNQSFQASREKQKYMEKKSDGK